MRETKREKKRELFSLFNTHSADRMKINACHTICWFYFVFSLYLSPFFSYALSLACLAPLCCMCIFCLVPYGKCTERADWANFCIKPLNFPKHGATGEKEKINFIRAFNCTFENGPHTATHIEQNSSQYYSHMLQRLFTEMWCGKFITWFVSSYPREIE